MNLLPRILKISALAAVLLAIAGAGVVALLKRPASHIVSGQSISQRIQRVNVLVADATRSQNRGDFQRAALQLKLALRFDPRNGKIRSQLGTALLQARDFTEAEVELLQAKSDGAKVEDYLPPLLQCMTIQGEWSNILDDYEEPDPNDKSLLAVKILRARALAYQENDDPADADASIDRSLAILRDVDGLLTRVQISIYQSRRSDAEKYLSEAAKLAPADPEVLMTKALLLRETDKYAALEIIDGVLKAQPDTLNAMMARIEVLIELGRYDEAERSVDAALARHPNIAFALYYKAMLLDLNNRPVEAWRIAEAVPREFVQSDAKFAMGMAQLAAASGNLESANAILTSYVAQHPAVVPARLQLVSLHLKMNDRKDALYDFQPLASSKDPKVQQIIAQTLAMLKGQGAFGSDFSAADPKALESIASKYQHALIDLGGGNYAQGLEEMSQGLKIDSSKMDAPQIGIEVLLKQSKFREAQSLADRAEAANAASPAPPFFRGEIFLAQGNIPASLTSFDLSLARDPRYLPALYARAQIFMVQKKYAEATEELEKIKSQQPDNALLDIELAETAAMLNQPLQSISLLKQALAKDPGQFAARLMLARYQLGLKQYSDAQQTLEAARRVSPGEYQQSSDAQILSGQALLASGDKNGAVAAFARAADLSPNVLAYRISLVDLQIQTGDSDGALATARNWAGTHKDADAAILLAETLARLKRLPEAASVIAASQKDHPDWRLTLWESQLATASGHSEQGLFVLKAWLADQPRDIPVRQAYAAALMDAGDNAGALAQYETILKSRNDIPEVLNNTAWLIRNTDPKRALQLANKAMELKPGFPDIGDTAGFLMLQNADAKGALPVLQQAHMMAPNSGEIAYHLALALNALGKSAQAKAVIQEAFAKDPAFADMAQARELLMGAGVPGQDRPASQKP